MGKPHDEPDPGHQLLTNLKAEGFTGQVQLTLQRGELAGAVLSPAGRESRPEWYGLERRQQTPADCHGGQVTNPSDLRLTPISVPPKKA